ncbi:MAG: Major Facilitator Superfamily transporter [Parcubacteria group bacterium Gr01-1014_30]|nr:MAG: Major Facilitator Superfamily transporter [Parcubacteria group bacterium Gr01-1014_30]
MDKSGAIANFIAAFPFFLYHQLMASTPKKVKLTYYLLTLFSTLAASFIWGINTLFLLDAGLSNTSAFAANAFFTAGMVLFEIPTGLVADTKGRGKSYELGSATLLIGTLIYWWLWQIHGPLWAWAIVSVILGLGFTFLSGAMEAWLVDALNATNYKGQLESVLARGQALGGTAMLLGSVAGGYIAQLINLGAPYLFRVGFLGVTLLISIFMMRDLGFTPQKGLGLAKHIKSVLTAAMENGWRNRSVKFLMLSAPFAGIGIYVFYAMQPYLLELYGNPQAYSVAGLAAAIVAAAQIVGGLSVDYVRRLFRTRTGLLITTEAIGVAVIALMGFVANFWAVVLLLILWGLIFAVAMPVRHAYLNGLIASHHRATVLSFDALLDSAGGAVTQPFLGRSADVFGYPASFVISAAIQVGALPLLIAAKRTHAPSDPITIPAH